MAYRTHRHRLADCRPLALVAPHLDMPDFPPVARLARYIAFG